MAFPLWNSTQDANMLLGFVDEYHELVRPPRKLYQKRTMTKITGVDGATSVAATRHFVSAGSVFTNVLVGAVIRIRDEGEPSDNGDFTVVSVVNTTTLLIGHDWEYGGKTGLSFEVLYHDEYGYAPTTTPLHTATAAIPFIVIYNPSEKVLTRYGIDKEVTAVVIFSAKTLADASIVPGDGDRFLDDNGREHEIVTIWPGDFFSGTGIALRWVGGSRVTEKRTIIPT